MMNDPRRSGQADGSRAGLCERCAHVQIVTSARGSRFYLCRLSFSDPRFPRYPPIPGAAVRRLPARARRARTGSNASIEARMHRIEPARLKPGVTV